jgi:hypothetical protein
MRNTIPPRSPQGEGDSASGREKKKDKGGTAAGEPGPTDVEKGQHKARDEHFGREQGGNQQGNQRGLGNPGDR